MGGCSGDSQPRDGGGRAGPFPCTGPVTGTLPQSPIPVTHSMLVDTNDAAVNDHGLVLIGSEPVRRCWVDRGRARGFGMPLSQHPTAVQMGTTGGKGTVTLSILWFR